MPPDNSEQEAKKGVILALGAFFIWGGMPSAFKLVSDVPLWETMSHRVLWGVIVVAVLITIGRRWGRLRSALRSRRNILVLTLTSVLLASNWVIFIFAVNANQVLQVSLGYFILPLVAVLLGVLFLHERLSKLQTLAVIIAAGGVLNQALLLGEVPWVSLALAVVFALYAYLRKIAKVEAIEGLFVETIVLLPPSLGFVAYQAMEGTSAALNSGPGVISSLIFLGVSTVAPLTLFTAAARRLRLSTVGLLQYIAPTLHFLTAILIWDEELTGAHLITFACIWTALGLYSWAPIIRARRA